MHRWASKKWRCQNEDAHNDRDSKYMKAKIIQL